MLQKNRGFTLVELVIVIIILGVLSSIGFVSYTNYISGSRDANRVSQIQDIYKALQLYATGKKLPYPDDYITVTASGTTVSYQGYAGKDTLDAIGYNDGGRDPKDNSYYTYILNKDRKRHQIFGFLEEKPEEYSYDDFDNKYPKTSGENIGAILQNTTKLPLQETSTGQKDIVNTGNTYNIIFSDEDVKSASGARLISLRPSYNCERLNQLGKFTGDGYYTIKPGTTEFRIYCDSSLFDSNLLVGEWFLGTGPQGNFNTYGASSLSERIYGETPFNTIEVLWEVTPNGTLNAADGGIYYNINPVPINHTKTYRASVWVKKTGTTDGRVLFGAATSSNMIFNLNDTLNNNPYFQTTPNTYNLNIGEWYLWVGYIHGSGYSDTNSYSAVYDTEGNVVLTGTDYKFDTTATSTWFRVFQYHDETTTNRQYYYDMRLEEIDVNKVGDVKDLIPVPVQ